MRLTAFTLLLSIGALSAAACDSWEQQERLAWVRDRMYPSATKTQLEKVQSWLITSTRSCPEAGDLWYYRGLVEQRLTGKASPMIAKRLEEYPSEAQQKGLDPFASGPVTPKQKLSPYVRDKWALLVGVEEFKDPRIPSLHYSTNDAKQLAALLTGPAGRFDPSHVKVLTDKNATKSEIMTALGDIRAVAQEDDLVLVYISSHGYPGNEDPTGISFVVTHDTDLSRPGTLFATSLPMVELSDFSRRLKSQRFVLILDTCFGGGAVEYSKTIKPIDSKPIDAFSGALHGMETGSGRAIIAASQSTEQSYESPDRKNGYFTYFLIAALKQDKGLDNLRTVYSYTQRNVADAVKNETGHNQTPVLDYTENGDQIVLGVELPKRSAATVLRPSKRSAHGQRDTQGPVATRVAIP